MNRMFTFAITAVLGASMMLPNLLGIKPFSTLSNPEAEATQVAAVATIASAQATIAAQMEKGNSLGLGGRDGVRSTTNVSPTSAVSVRSAGSKPQPSKSGESVSGVIYYDAPTPEDLKPGEPVFRETFDNGLKPGWILNDDRWSIVDGSLTFTHSGKAKDSSARAFLPILVSGDYQIELDINWPKAHSNGYSNDESVWVNVGGVRGSTHPYFIGTEYESSSTQFTLAIWDKANNQDSFLRLWKYKDDNYVSFDSTLRTYPNNTLMPGKHRYTFLVRGNDYIVKLDGKQVIKHYEMERDTNDTPRALYLALGFSVRDRMISNLMPLPSFDNIEVRLLDTE